MSVNGRTNTDRKRSLLPITLSELSLDLKEVGHHLF